MGPIIVLLCQAEIKSDKFFFITAIRKKLDKKPFKKLVCDGILDKQSNERFHREKAEESARTRRRSATKIKKKCNFIPTNIL